MTFNLAKQLEGHAAEVRCCAVLKSGLVVTGGFDAACIVWDVSSGSLISKCFGHSDFVYALAAHPANPDWFCSSGKDRKIFVFDSISGERVSDFKMAPEIHKGPICSLTSVGSSTLVAGSWDGSISMWSLDTYELVAHLPQAGAYAVVSAASDETSFITGSQDKNLKWWDMNGNLVHQIANAHSDIVRSMVAQFGVLATCSNDCVVKLWTLERTPISELHGHTNFVFSVDLSESNVFSSGEDRTLRVWTRQELQQSILHPGTVWFAKWHTKLECLVSGCSDGIVRVFSANENSWAPLEERETFDALSAASQPANQPAVDPATVPAEAEMARYRGKKVGEVKMFKDLENAVYAYQWTQSGSWDKIGLVTSSVMSGGSKTNYVGDQYFSAGEYEFVFDVELGADRMAKLPYNKSDNPLSVAEKFCAREQIKKANVEQIVTFIRQNAPQPVASLPVQQAFASSHFPPLAAYAFRETKWEAMSEKLRTFVLPEEVSLLNSVLFTLQNKSPIDEFRPSEVNLIHTKLLSVVPVDQLFVLFDLWRLFVLHPAAAVMYKNSDRGAQYIATAAKYLAVQNNTGLCMARYLANLFALSVSKWAAVEHYTVYLPIVFSVLAIPSVSKQTHIACASVVANLATTTTEKRNEPLSNELARGISGLNFEILDTDTIYRLLVAAGCLATFGVSEVLEKTKFYPQEQLQACREDIQKILSNM